MLLGVGENAIAQLPGFLGFERRIIQWYKLTSQSYHGRNAGCNMEVRGSSFHHLF
jgi:hypothetical protein